MYAALAIAFAAPDFAIKDGHDTQSALQIRSNLLDGRIVQLEQTTREIEKVDEKLESCKTKVVTMKNEVKSIASALTEIKAELKRLNEPDSPGNE